MGGITILVSWGDRGELEVWKNLKKCKKKKLYFKNSIMYKIA